MFVSSLTKSSINNEENCMIFICNFVFKVNYNDAADGREDLSWQEQGSDYNSDFSMPSDNDNDDEFDEKNESKCFIFHRH